MPMPLAPALLCAAAFLSAPALAQEAQLTMHDVSADLGRLIGGTQLDFVTKARIRYGVTGNDRYDTFFRESAIAYGGMTVGRGLSDEATLKLKAYARSKMAIAELEAQIKELTGGAPPEQWTTEQSIAVLQAAKEKDRLTDEERGYSVSMTANLAATIPVVHASIASSNDLLGQVTGLVDGSRSAFGLLRAPGVARNVHRSAERIRIIPTEGVGLVESLTVLSRGFSMMSGQ